MRHKRIPRRIRKQEWKRLGFTSPRSMRRVNEAMRHLARLVENIATPIARSFKAMVGSFAKMASLDDRAANLGLERMVDESDEDLRVRCRDRFALAMSTP